MRHPPRSAMDFSWESVSSAKRAALLKVRMKHAAKRQRPTPTPATASKRLRSNSVEEPKTPGPGAPGPRRLADDITVGSDCAGLGTERTALEMLGLEHRVVYEFASESDPRTRALYLMNHPGCHKVYDTCELSHRAVNRVPRVDLYIAGAPCPAWSIAGKRLGVQDSGGPKQSSRGAIFFDCLGYIRERKPRTFILEQVEGMTFGRTKATFENVITILNNIEHHNHPLYHVEWRVLNASEFTGIPQNRPRLFICGVYRSKMGKGTLEWPRPVPMVRLSAFLAPNKLESWIPRSAAQLRKLIHGLEHTTEKNGENPANVMYAIDINSSENFGQSCLREKIPALTRSRAGTGGFYLSSWGRMLSTEEMAKLQGIDMSRIKRHHVTHRQYCMMLGNAMSVPLLARLLRMVLGAAGYIDLEDVEDPVKSFEG